MSTQQLAIQAPRRVAWMYWRPFWAAVAILGMWIAVLVDAVWGTDIVTTTVSTRTSLPAAIPIAFFASIATIFVARYGFRADEKPE